MSELSREERIERLARQALAEYREPFALTDAIRARSTSRKKTRAKHAAEAARLNALCECLWVLGWRDTLSWADARQRLEREAAAPVSERSERS